MYAKWRCAGSGVSLGDEAWYPPQKENGLKGEAALQAIHEYFWDQKCVFKPTRAIAWVWPLDAPFALFMPLICAKPPELAR